MRFYAVSDLHMCSKGSKPMDIFGAKWENYLEKIDMAYADLSDDDRQFLLEIYQDDEFINQQ